MLKLACKYMRYYKCQTFAIWMSILLTAALLSGISSLMYSSRMNDLKNNKMIYGDWHYCLKASQELFSAVAENEKADGYDLEQCGKVIVCDIITEPYLIYFVNADEAYMQMEHCELVEGRYPKKGNEMVADWYTLGYMGFSGHIGDSFLLNGKPYVLTGIVKSRWASGTEEMRIFVGGEFEGQGFLYLRFAEDKKLYQQLDAFSQKYQISGDAVEVNDRVTAYLGGEKPDHIFDIVRFALTDKNGNFTYIVLKLQSEYNLAYHGMIFLLCIFSLFIIYSIFHISVSKRTAQYGMMQTLGISEKRIEGTLILELWLLFLTGYPIGCLLGNGVLKLFYGQLNAVFSGNKAGQIFIQEEVGTIMFRMSWSTIRIGFVFLLAALAIVGVLTVRSMRKYSICQGMNGDTSFIKKRRKIYCIRTYNLANIVVRKFMFSNRKKAIGILLSLSIGGCIFLCTTYLTENLKIHAEMALKSDDGLGSDYQISVKSEFLSDMIPTANVDEMREMTDLTQIYATKYILGELIIQEGELEWEEYFDEQNKDEYYLQRFGGICVSKEDGTYGIKYDVYGYETDMLQQLQDFVLEGEIVPEKLGKENKIIAVANQDGQGNYNFYGKHSGDVITLRVPKSLNCSEADLKFGSTAEHYIEKEFEIAAVVSRALAKEEGWLNVEPWNNSQSFIMTNEQMYNLYGISDYSIVNVTANDGAETAVLSSQLLQTIKDVPKVILKDYTNAIATQKQYLWRQQLFFSGIAVILFMISLFHIVNSMNYTILSHRREYGMIRAMGITDIGFYKMIIRTGFLYGLLTDIFIFLFYNLVLRRAMDYYMAHVVQFLHFTAGVPTGIMAIVMGLNLLLAIAAVLIPAKRIVKSSIIGEIIV